MANFEKEVKNNIFGFGGKNVDYAKYFIGESYLKSLVREDDIDVHVGNVSFEPGCRNNWHIHHNGYQILLVTDGKGWYQEAKIKLVIETAKAVAAFLASYPAIGLVS